MKIDPALILFDQAINSQCPIASQKTCSELSSSFLFTKKSTITNTVDSLIRLAGSADINDVSLITQNLQLIPMTALQFLQSCETKIVICRNSITEHRSELKGVNPRGWPRNYTWDNVPGVFNRDRNEVVISTIAHNSISGPRVPKTGEAHGSFNLVLHEVFHALDYHLHNSFNSNSESFNDARSKDLNSLNQYESQPGKAGLEETFAESAARYFGGSACDKLRHPNLNEYWADYSFPC